MIMAKVLLLERVPNLWKQGEVVEVKDWYFSNFILPKKLWRIVTDNDIKNIEENKKKDQARKVELIEKRHEIAETLNWKELTFKMKSKSWKIFWSIWEKEVIKEVKNKFWFELEKKHIDFWPDWHIKKLENRDVSIKLWSDVFCRVKILIKQDS